MNGGQASRPFSTEWLRERRGLMFLLAILLGIWQGISFTQASTLAWIWSTMNWPPPVPDLKFLSSPVEVLREVPAELRRGELVSAFLQTLGHTLSAFVIALIVGTALVRLMISFESWRRSVLPLVHALSGIPPVTLLPLFLVAFSLGGGSVVALSVFGATLSIILITYEALSTLKADFRTMISKLGYSSFGVWLWEFSAASDRLHTAAREGMRWCLILSVVGEMHGSVAGGLGAYVDSGRLNQNYAQVYIGILACGALATASNAGLNLGARLLHGMTKRLLLGKNPVSLELLWRKVQ